MRVITLVLVLTTLNFKPYSIKYICNTTITHETNANVGFSLLNNLNNRKKDFEVYICTAKSDTLGVIKRFLGVIGMDEECLFCILRGVTASTILDLCCVWPYKTSHIISLWAHIQATSELVMVSSKIILLHGKENRWLLNVESGSLALRCVNDEVESLLAR